MEVDLSVKSVKQDCNQHFELGGGAAHRYASVELLGSTTK